MTGADSDPHEELAGAFGLDGEFGHVQRASNRVAASHSHALRMGADNLLDKALRRMESGDPERAEAFLERAVALPYDEHEECLPAQRAAHMRLFCSVTDDLEATSVGDATWLARCLGVIEALAAGELDFALGAMYDVLSVVLQDFELTGSEVSAIRGAIPSDWDRERLGRQAVQDPSMRTTIVGQNLQALLCWQNPAADLTRQSDARIAHRDVR